MAGSTLVLVTFLSGAAWGPLATLQPTTSPSACHALRAGVADTIQKSAITNINMPPAIEKDGNDLVVVGAARRVMARLSCL